MQLLACQLFGERGEANEGYPGIDSESRRRTGTHPHYQQFQLEGLTPLMQQNEKSWAPPEFLPQAECPFSTKGWGNEATGKATLLRQHLHLF